jgi:hypothetical protein
MGDHMSEKYAAVDFIINVFERTYRDVLRPGGVNERASYHLYPFAKRVIVVNNVNDRQEVEGLLAVLVESGEVTEFYFVTLRLEESLQKAGLTLADIKKTMNYTGWALVAVCLTGSPYMVHCDADVFLDTPVDWITPSLELMHRDGRIAVANPNWANSSVDVESRETDGNFGIGYGFSDQIFLISRIEFARNVYKCWSPYSWRYPLSQYSAIFEQRVDAYMRSRRRMRATYKLATYVHPAEGESHRKDSVTSKFKRSAMLFTMKLFKLLPLRDPRFNQ